MFYSIPNLRSSTAVEMPEPWNYVPKVPPPYEDKAKLISWSAEYTTQHAFISGYEGMTPVVAVSKNDDNPPFRVHALIVDYDGKLPPDTAEYLLKDPASEFMPAYLVKTGSNNARLIWIFERPMMLANKTQTKEFLKAAAKHLKLQKWLPGFDAAAYGEPGQYYEVGPAWTEIKPDARIPASHTELWMLRASSELRFDNEKRLEYKIPIEEVAKEVEARFPGRWKGPFAIRAHGVRFWDQDADAERGAYVMEEGMLCFTGPRAFMSWKDIFGSAFVSQFESSYIAGVVEDSAYDGKSFWLREGERWTEWNKEDFSQELRCRGYDGRKKQGKAASELDTIENTIKRTRRVSKALPFLFFPSGPISYQGQHYLNTSCVRPIAPAPPVSEGPITFVDGRKHFPLIYKLLRHMFVAEGSDESSDEQLTAFLAWLKYFYSNSKAQTPRPGHTIVLAGPAGKGKTLLSKVILGGLMGGEADASSHLVDGSEWTERLIGVPIMRIDDSLAISDPKGLLKFSNRLKKYTANAEMLYNQKYQKTGTVPWFGRTIVTCNLDSESLKILPDMDISTQDKISLFKASEHIINFPDWGVVMQQIPRELPFFARFLEDWQIPEGWIAGEKRFGVRPYHHPELFEESRQQGLGAMLELLHGFLTKYQEAQPGRVLWEGTATQLLADLSAYSPEITRDLRVAQVGTQLGKLAKNGYNLARYKDPDTSMNMWRIAFDLMNTKKQETA